MVVWKGVEAKHHEYCYGNHPFSSCYIHVTLVTRLIRIVLQNNSYQLSQGGQTLLLTP